jgi:hypothetical protein
MRVIGPTSETSHDGVDRCHVEFIQDGTRLEARILGADVVPYPEELGPVIAGLPRSGLPAPTRLVVR